MTITELRTLIASLMAKAQVLTDKATAEERELTDEEVAEVDAILTEHDETKVKLEAAERRARTIDRVAALATPAPSGRQVPPAAPANVDPARIIVSDPREADACHGYSDVRIFLNDVLIQGTGAPEPQALQGLRINAAAGSDEAGLYADPYGGYLVPEGFLPQLRMIAPEADPMGSAVTSIPMSTGKVSFPARVDKAHSTSVSGGLTVSRRAEADTSASSRIQFERVSIEALSLFGISYATEELLADSPISFVALLEQGFRDEFQAAIINERINGTGVGQMLGVLNSGALLSITKETNQVADTITYQNLIKMYARLWGKGRGIWLVNHNTLPQLMQITLDVGTAGVAMWNTSIVPGVPSTLIGLPVIPTEYTKTVGDKGDIILGDWSQFIEGTRAGITGAESIHVRFTVNERAFRFAMRIGGTPWWSSKLTPKNGDTMSPFVVLDARA